jgi:hypothetical protein
MSVFDCMTARVDKIVSGKFSDGHWMCVLLFSSGWPHQVVCASSAS